MKKLLFIAELVSHLNWCLEFEKKYFEIFYSVNI